MCGYVDLSMDAKPINAILQMLEVRDDLVVHGGCQEELGGRDGPSVEVVKQPAVDVAFAQMLKALHRDVETALDPLEDLPAANEVPLVHDPE